MVFIDYIRILSSITMPTCDVLLRHFRKMLLYMQGYAIAYSHLLSTLDRSHAVLFTNLQSLFYACLEEALEKAVLRES